jgi:hypothetical protein
MGGMIRAAHYDEEEARIAATPEAQSMYRELPYEAKRNLADPYMEPTLSFMMAANKEYTRRSHDHGAHIGAVAYALRLIAHDHPPTC